MTSNEWLDRLEELAAAPPEHLSESVRLAVQSRLQSTALLVRSYGSERSWMTAKVVVTIGDDDAK